MITKGITIKIKGVVVKKKIKTLKNNFNLQRSSFLQSLNLRIKYCCQHLQICRPKSKGLKTDMPLLLAKYFHVSLHKHT